MLYHPLRQKNPRVSPEHDALTRAPETHTTLRDPEDLTETSVRSHQWFGKLSIQKSLTLKRWRYPVAGLLVTFALIAVLSPGPGNESARRRMPAISETIMRWVKSWFFLRTTPKETIDPKRDATALQKSFETVSKSDFGATSGTGATDDWADASGFEVVDGSLEPVYDTVDTTSLDCSLALAQLYLQGDAAENQAFAAESVLQGADFIAQFMPQKDHLRYQAEFRECSTKKNFRIGEGLHRPVTKNGRTTGVYKSGFGFYYKGTITKKAQCLCEVLKTAKTESSPFDVQAMSYDAMCKFVKKETDSKIEHPGLTEQFIDDVDTRAVLIQVMNIVQPWPENLEPTDVSRMDFNNKKVKGFMLTLDRRSGAYRYTNGKFNVFKVPLGEPAKNSQHSLYAVFAHIKGDGAVCNLKALMKDAENIRALTGQGLSSINKECELYIPNVKDTFEIDISGTNDKLKLNNITELVSDINKPLSVAKIIQQITLGLDRKGVDATVVTSFGVVPESFTIGHDPEKYYLNSSFLFSLVQENPRDSQFQPRMILQATISQAAS